MGEKQITDNRLQKTDMIRKIYDGVRGVMPASVKVGMSKAAFNMLDKPRYDETGMIPLDKGIVVISADFELAWAWRFSKRKVDALEMARRERENFPIILNKLNELDIPITWATVGHLLLDSCSCGNGRAHDCMPRPDYFENEHWKYDKGDWYDIDPCGDFKKNPEFYAPDLIELILNSKTKHEIGCHSFSHCDFSERNSYTELIEAELSECEKAFNKFGIKPESFVFPGNQSGNFELLKKYGYKIVRFKSNKDKELGFPEKLKNGLFAIHDSTSFEPGEKGWKYDDLVGRAKKYIEKAIEKKAVCHFWFHPSIDKNLMYEYFFVVLNLIADYRNKGLVDVKYMRDLVNGDG
jgi:hypothetical protein